FVNVLDKRLLTHHVPSLLMFCFLVGIIQVILAAAVLIAVPWKSGAPLNALLIGVGSGAVAGVQLLFLFYGTRALEVSRVVLIYHTFPVPAAIMAFLLLDERLVAVQWAAIVVTVLGAGLAAIEPGKTERRNKNLLAYSLVVGASVLFAASNVGTKYAFDEMDFWNLYVVRTGVMGLVLIAPLARPRLVPELKHVLANRAGMRFLVINEGVIASIAAFAMLIALNVGPVSLVSTLMATRPFIVLTVSALLSSRPWHFLDEPLRRDTLAWKLLSAVMLVGGVSVLILA
ncbi:MAG: DMT family transporter, partial [Chloroflexi bacterium]|nr:DMT family transporter [Chloroflexota bacterium]